MILFREKYSFQHTVGKAGSLAKGSIREYSFPPLVFVVNFYVLICVKFLWELQEQLIFFKYQFFTEACGWEWSEGLQFSLTKCFLFSVTPGNNNGSQEFGSLKQMVEVLCCHPGQNRCWLKEIWLFGVWHFMARK